MKKEIIVCIIIVIAIIVGNIITQNYTVKSIGILSEELEELKKDVIEAEENGEEEVNENIKNNLEKLDTKYLISEIINTPDFIEGKILKNTIQETGKSMLENVNTYKRLQEDYKEYIELWIHEIKIPIATSKLIIENNKNEITKSIDEELDEIENYTEQALFYARSNTVNKDYVVTKSNLKEIVNEAILKSKRALLSNKISIELNDLEKEVFTDSKWATFIINQIIQNSIKYSKKEDKKKP